MQIVLVLCIPEIVVIILIFHAWMELRKKGVVKKVAPAHEVLELKKLDDDAWIWRSGFIRTPLR